MTVKRTSVLAVLGTILAVLAGCGSSSSSSTSSTNASAPASTSTSAAGQGSAGSYGKQAASTTSGSAAPTSVLISAKHGKQGTILAMGPKHMTVYLFEADKSGGSACTGACAGAWPPVTGTPQAGSGASTSKLGQITRSDGTKQVTYNGHPLYVFVKDEDSGDAYGEGVRTFGAEWYVLAPSGNKVDEADNGSS